jgi:hypothetical protein
VFAKLVYLNQNELIKIQIQIKLTK